MSFESKLRDIILDALKSPMGPGDTGPPVYDTELEEREAAYDEEERKGTLPEKKPETPKGSNFFEGLDDIKQSSILRSTKMDEKRLEEIIRKSVINVLKGDMYPEGTDFLNLADHAAEMSGVESPLEHSNIVRNKQARNLLEEGLQGLDPEDAEGAARAADIANRRAMSAGEDALLRRMDRLSWTQSGKSTPEELKEGLSRAYSKMASFSPDYLEQIVRKAVMDVLKNIDMSPKYVADADKYYEDEEPTQAETANFLDDADYVAGERARGETRPPLGPSEVEARGRNPVLRAGRIIGKYNKAGKKIASLAEEYMNVRGYDTAAIEKRASIVEEAIKSTNINADDFRMYANKYFR